MDYGSLSNQGSIQLRFRRVCDLAMIYNKDCCTDRVDLMLSTLMPRINKLYLLPSVSRNSYRYKVG